jgi:hypothetical protein
MARRRVVDAGRARMQAAAQSGTSAFAESPSRVDLIYVPALGDWRAFEAALQSVAKRFFGRVRMVRASRAGLRALTSARLFLSESVPNVVVLRRGELVAQAVGVLPMMELKGILEEALR